MHLLILLCPFENHCCVAHLHQVMQDGLSNYHKLNGKMVTFIEDKTITFSSFSLARHVCATLVSTQFFLHYSISPLNSCYTSFSTIPFYLIAKGNKKKKKKHDWISSQRVRATLICTSSFSMGTVFPFPRIVILILEGVE